jgi:hypothetical protein
MLLGRVILDEGLRMLAALTVTNRLAGKREALAEASGRLDALRINLRLAKRLGFLSNPGYESLTGTTASLRRRSPEHNPAHASYARRGELPAHHARCRAERQPPPKREHPRRAP